VRFPREHEFFEDGDVLRHLYLQDVLTQVTEAPERPRVPEFTCQVAGCCQVFDSLEDFEHHYHTLHRNVCSFCRRAFPSVHLLDIHILEWHDSLFQILSERQDMYQCLVEGCLEKFKTSKDRKDHLVRCHLYPADFRFDKPKKSRGPATPGAAVQAPSPFPALRRRPCADCPGAQAGGLLAVDPALACGAGLCAVPPTVQVPDANRAASLL
ncbi:zinc finger protein 511, partial [Suricata suricatta]|uniref:zinc finger protein 511 n=1 Tax=Suricata suricatta TaxID=37032 RepID=UPI0011559901